MGSNITAVMQAIENLAQTKGHWIKNKVESTILTIQNTTYRIQSDFVKIYLSKNNRHVETSCFTYVWMSNVGVFEKHKKTKPDKSKEKKHQTVLT